MGEKTKDLARFKLASAEVTVELNDPVYEGDSPIVHIQTQTNRIECTFEEFFSLAATVLVAEKNLKIIKEME